MRTRHYLSAFGFLAAGLMVSATASADLIDFVGGVKGFAGGNVWTTPKNVPGGYEGHGFAGSAGGFGWGAGFYGELRILKFLGLELDFYYDQSTLFRDITTHISQYPNAKVESREKITMNTLRVPVLAKGMLPTPFGRLCTFFGPEFVIPTSVSGGVEQTGGTPGVVLQNPESLMTAKKEGSTLFTFGLGLVIDLPLKLEIPIDLRASKNLSQPSDWSERVTWATPQYGTPYTIKGQSTWDFRLGLGLGYRF